MPVNIAQGSISPSPHPTRSLANTLPGQLLHEGQAPIHPSRSLSLFLSLASLMSVCLIEGAYVHHTSNYGSECILHWLQLAPDEAFTSSCLHFLASLEPGKNSLHQSVFNVHRFLLLFSALSIFKYYWPSLHQAKCTADFLGKN